jgi:pilus assembly protein Flp/PilA
MKKLIVRFVREDEGQDLIEYVLIGGLVSLASIAALTALGGGLSTWYDTTATYVGTIGPTP